MPHGNAQGIQPRIIIRGWFGYPPPVRAGGERGQEARVTITWPPTPRPCLSRGIRRLTGGEKSANMRVCHNECQESCRYIAYE